MLKVLVDTSALRNANAIRGVGLYTKLLRDELRKIPDVELVTSDAADVDVIHYPYFDFFFPTLPIFRKKPTVVTVHDVIPLLFPKFYRAGRKGRLQFYRQRFGLQRANAVLTDSESSKKDIVKYLKIHPDKVFVVYLAGNPEISKSSADEVQKVQKKYDLPPKYVLYVGDINYNKNLPELIKSVKFLPADVHLVCVGKNFFPHNIPEWKWIETQIAVSDVAKQVHFVTDLAGNATKELSALYTGAAAYIQPSLYEGFGLPLLEAMQCETSVVSARNSSLVEVGGDHVQYVETDPESIAPALKEFLICSDPMPKIKIPAALHFL